MLNSPFHNMKNYANVGDTYRRFALSSSYNAQPHPIIGKYLQISGIFL